ANVQSRHRLDASLISGGGISRRRAQSDRAARVDRDGGKAEVLLKDFALLLRWRVECTDGEERHGVRALVHDGQETVVECLLLSSIAARAGSVRVADVAQRNM